MVVIGSRTANKYTVMSVARVSDGFNTVAKEAFFFFSKVVHTFVNSIITQLIFFFFFPKKVTQGVVELTVVRACSSFPAFIRARNKEIFASLFLPITSFESSSSSAAAAAVLLSGLFSLTSDPR